MSNSVSWLAVIIAVMCLDYDTNALDNGLALAPPMGFMTWQRYRCITDCDLYPDECISEWLIKNTTDLMVANGYREAGYEYIIIDDCWLEWERDPETSEMVADRKRFPNGMKSLADYVHSKGLKFGMYQDYGTKTCAGYPGIIDHMELDAKTFAGWEIDYLKLDGCYVDTDKMDEGYPEFGRILNATGRSIVYSCSWPAYQEAPKYDQIKKYCNLWRNGGDIQDSYGSLRSVIDFFANNQLTFQKHAGPGHWNDPDMLLIGNFGLTIDQSKMQMALWAILAAPLLMSTDLKNIRPEFAEILLNKPIIAVNQDPLGIQGLRVKQDKNIEFWVRKISPIVDKDYSYAVAWISKRDDGAPFAISTKPSDLGLNHTHGYLVNDLYDSKNSFKILDPNQNLTVRVNPSGVVFYKFTPLQPKNTKVFIPKSIIDIMSRKSIYQNEILPGKHRFN